MKLVQYCNSPLSICPAGRSVHSFRAIAAAWVVIASIAQTESRAAIVITARVGSASVQGFLEGGAAGQPRSEFNGYQVDLPVPAGLAPFNLHALPPEGTTTIMGASATSDAQLDATIIQDLLADTLFVSSVGSAGASVSADQTLRQNAAEGIGGTSFSLFFQIDRPYAYDITSALFAGAQAIPNEDADAESIITLRRGGASSFTFVRDTFFPTPHRQQGGAGPDVGALTGTLVPGNYSLGFQTLAGLNNFEGTSANADYSFTLQLTPASRWINPVNGSFQDPTKWFAPFVPGAQDVAVFDVPGTYTVQLNQDTTNKQLRANGAGVNLTLDLNGSEYTADEISVGDNAEITFGDSNPPVSIVASAAADDGLARAAANGTAERRVIAQLLKAADGGKATVKIPIMTTAGLIGGGGSVRVRNDGRWDVESLELSQGGLTVIDGGGITSSVVTALAPLKTDVSSALVTGPGSFLANQQLDVGEAGNGTLNIFNKCTVSARHIAIGVEAGSTGLIEVDDASLSATSALSVGDAGAGTLTVKNGALVKSEGLFIGNAALGNGTATVESLGELRVHGRLRVGEGGNGRLTVDGGSVEQTSTDPSEFSRIGTTGVLEVLSGHFHERQALGVNGTLALKAAVGSASVGINSVATPGHLTVGPGGILGGNGVIKGKVNVPFGGTVLPGTSPGTLTIDGDYEQTGGLLGIEIAGLAAGEFDVLAVTGNALLGGALVLEFIDGFAPHQGDVFKFLDIDGTTTGAFQTVEVRNLLPGFQFDLRPDDAGGLTLLALNDGVFVPEPATLAMLIFAGILATLGRRGGVGTVERRGVAD